MGCADSYFYCCTGTRSKNKKEQDYYLVCSFFVCLQISVDDVEVECVFVTQSHSGVFVCLFWSFLLISSYASMYNAYPTAKIGANTHTVRGVPSIIG